MQYKDEMIKDEIVKDCQYDLMIGHTNNSIIDIEELKTKVKELGFDINIRHIDVHNQGVAFRNLVEGSVFLICYNYDQKAPLCGITRTIWSVKKDKVRVANGFCMLMNNIDKRYYTPEHIGTFAEGIVKPTIEGFIERIKNSITYFNSIFNINN